MEAQAPKRTSRFYAVTVVAGMEPRVALVINERAQELGLDVRSIIVPARIKGYVILEVGDLGDVTEAVRGVRYVKRKRPILMRFEEVLGIAKPKQEIPSLRRGQKVEIISGPFKGMIGTVEEVDAQRNQVSITLAEQTFRGTVTLPIEDVKPLEEES